MCWEDTKAYIYLISWKYKATIYNLKDTAGSGALCFTTSDSHHYE